MPQFSKLLRYHVGMTGYSTCRAMFAVTVWRTVPRLRFPGRRRVARSRGYGCRTGLAVGHRTIQTHALLGLKP
eukprot:14063932-Heterocapsa_arctica.AAC.1